MLLKLDHQTSTLELESRSQKRAQKAGGYRKVQRYTRYPLKLSREILADFFKFGRLA